MKNSSRLSLTLALCLLLAFSAACRTRTKKKPVTPGTTPVTDTAPAVDPVRTDTAATVDDRETDFVEERDPVTTEELPADLDELNRQASERGWIRDAFFEYDASTLSADAQEALTTTASWLKAHPRYQLLIEGHCDSRGTSQYNLALGDRRANTAREYLVTLGIDAGRLKTVSYGEERPFETGDSEEAHRSNRRAHLVISGR